MLTTTQRVTQSAIYFCSTINNLKIPKHSSIERELAECRELFEMVCYHHDAHTCLFDSRPMFDTRTHRMRIAVWTNWCSLWIFRRNLYASQCPNFCLPFSVALQWFLVDLASQMWPSRMSGRFCFFRQVAAFHYKFTRHVKWRRDWLNFTWRGHSKIPSCSYSGPLTFTLSPLSSPFNIYYRPYHAFYLCPSNRTGFVNDPLKGNLQNGLFNRVQKFQNDAQRIRNLKIGSILAIFIYANANDVTIWISNGKT